MIDHSMNQKPYIYFRRNKLKLKKKSTRPCGIDTDKS